MNAVIVKQKKIGKILNYNGLDEEALETAIKQQMDIKTVQSNVEEMSSLVKDSRTHPLEVNAESKHEFKIEKDKYSEQTLY
jgi:UDP:flavonoid glycosyltransferase YjiC (YdhE family)